MLLRRPFSRGKWLLILWKVLHARIEVSLPVTTRLAPIGNTRYTQAYVTYGKQDSNNKARVDLLIHQLPPKPTNLRVRIWRKLQKLGAVAIKNSVYVLPATEKAHEDFQWLKQEIESAGGEASVFKAASVEGATDQEIIAAFRKARDEEFAAVAAEFDGLTGAIREQSRGKHLSAGRLSAHES